MNTNDLIDLIQSTVSRVGSQKETAKMLNISEQFLCDILKKRRQPTARVGEFFGLKPVVTWEKL